MQIIFSLGHFSNTYLKYRIYITVYTYVQMLQLMFPSGHLFLILLLAQLWLFVHNDCMPLPNEKRMPNVEAATHTKSKPA